jgi:hypothetical protein
MLLSIHVFWYFFSMSSSIFPLWIFDLEFGFPLWINWIFFFCLAQKRTEASIISLRHIITNEHSSINFSYYFSSVVFFSLFVNCSIFYSNLSEINSLQTNSFGTLIFFYRDQIHVCTSRLCILSVGGLQRKERWKKSLYSLTFIQWSMSSLRLYKQYLFQYEKISDSRYRKEKIAFLRTCPCTPSLKENVCLFMWPRLSLLIFKPWGIINIRNNNNNKLKICSW